VLEESAQGCRSLPDPSETGEQQDAIKQRGSIQHL